MHPKIINAFVLVNSFINSYETNIGTEDIIAFRDDFIKNTNEIRDIIYKEHGERASFYITFAMYSYCDEMINNINLTSGVNISDWHLLQEEVYQRNDGGDYFFEIVDSVLDNPVFPRVVAEVLYLVLSLGFKGCYLGVESEIDKYKSKLCMILPEHNVEALDPNVFNGKLTMFKRGYRSKLIKMFFFASICFPILAYFGILAIK